MFTIPFSILQVFDELPGPRQDAKVLYDLPEMIFIALSGAVANCDSWTDIELYAREHLDDFRKYVPLPNGIPSHDTFSRVFSRLDPVLFAECLIKWIDSLQLTLKVQGVHLDGKVLRRSFDAAAGKGALNVVTAWAGDLHLCLGQLPVAAGSNERTAVPKLLQMLELTGAVVTLDTMHTQKSTARQIRGKEADYVLTVKRNQKTLYNLIQGRFADLTKDDFRSSRVRRYT
ncbi:Transposase DDE domain protein [Polystyrenella longa]|uniref:Transposase DDE domain protein n=1 Tax=Polystyrenella longa TaxID=2528007 RepID=A0A518CL46_9PLAN|nr:ISAs1 family transposase [Polystyrenella longa]QDU79947.1 Transposase DDE domain protein [Polystyrenella longa]